LAYNHAKFPPLAGIYHLLKNLWNVLHTTNSSTIVQDFKNPARANQKLETQHQQFLL